MAFTHQHQRSPARRVVDEDGYLIVQRQGPANHWLNEFRIHTEGEILFVDQFQGQNDAKEESGRQVSKQWTEFCRFAVKDVEETQSSLVTSIHAAETWDDNLPKRVK